MSWDTAVMSLVGASALGITLAEGERSRVGYIRAMRRCLFQIQGILRYDQPPLDDLLMRIELNTTRQEKQLTGLLHACADKLRVSTNPQLLKLFEKERMRLSGYAVLSEEDRLGFEEILSELGRTGMQEQVRLLEIADERLRRREEILLQECERRSKLIRTLGVTGGAAAFLLFI